MSPSLRVLPKAFVLAVCSALFVVAPASAQFYESVLKSVDASNDLARSPRLLGMGQLSLAVPDRGNALTLWDFAASPVGLGQHDSTSTLDLYPGTNSASGAHDAMDGHYRQDLGARGTRMGFETMRRDDEGNGFGIVGTFSGITSATPYAADQIGRAHV